MRKLVLSDTERMAEIMQSSCENEYWSASEISSMLSDMTFFGYIENHGFILCRRGGNAVDICMLGVEPEFRRRYIGRQLLSSVIEFSRNNLCDIFLETAVNNFPAINLYKSAGFEVISVRKKYYKTKEGSIDAILMKLQFEPNIQQS